MTVRKLERDDCIVTDRGGIVENRHQIHAAVTDATGKILYSVGDPSRITLARSAAKPAQALAILETGGFDQFGFDDADLALMCASHSSEDRHVDRARTMLEKTQAREEDLRHGGHPAVWEVVNRVWIKNDYTPTALCNNCSGKHVGMLAGAMAIGVGIADYHLPSHPIQLHVKSVVDELCGLDEGISKWCVDGCNLPAPAFELHYMARLYASFAAAADAPGQDENTNDRIQHMGRIFRAMAQYPELVGGHERFCTVLMESFQGELIGKIGADACYGVGVRASEQTRRLGAEGAIGIAVKVEDGSIPILYSAEAEILEQLQIGTPAMRQSLDGFHYRSIKNTAGVVTGRTSHLFKLRPT
ncbi:L-asparaginase II [Aspergillus avenaceus]|uniref:L-asparaginase II n=1 Tax=Aspergillus avenaceus TaxID=36643 RepID=A0A5N6TUK4_ASPAV|nr:L-asparaginase II [Aspergillus avenaceus]